MAIVLLFLCAVSAYEVAGLLRLCMRPKTVVDLPSSIKARADLGEISHARTRQDLETLSDGFSLQGMQ
ncbi:MAG TPA: hypothetical protein VGK89_07775 [Candidatus Eisenbacteria bacterium]|jgi:hypothetical protein